MPLTNQPLNVTLGGNTDGVMALVSSGTFTLAGGDNITLSQNGNAVTVIGGAGVGGAFAGGVSTGGNTAGDTKTVASQVVFVGGNNITLSQGTNGASATVTVSALNMFSAGISNVGNTSGTSGMQSGRLVLAGGNNITISQATAAGGLGTVSVSGINAGAQLMSFWQNLGVAGSAPDAMAQTNFTNGEMHIFQLDIGNNIFAGNMTVSSMYLNVTMNRTQTLGSHGSSVYFGLYTVNGSNLSLHNSGSMSFGNTGSSGVSVSASNLYHGKRYLSIPTANFSASLTMSQTLYYGALFFLTAGTSVALSNFGAYLGESGQRSGTFNAGSVTNTYIGMLPFMGVYENSTNAFPASIASQSIRKTGARDMFVPHVVFNNIVASF